MIRRAALVALMVASGCRTTTEPLHVVECTYKLNHSGVPECYVEDVAPSWRPTDHTKGDITL